MVKSYYEILNIEETAKKSEIKARYKKLIRLYHPDINKNPQAESIFKEINRAANVLLDDEKRKKYDDFRLSLKLKNSSSSKMQEGFQNKGGEENHRQSFEKTEKPLDGKDITLNVKINYQEALLGTKKTINIAHSAICPKCEGRKFANGAKCSYCGGIGEKVETKKITVKIPPSIKNHAKLRLLNEGEKGLYGGKNGNPYIIVEIEKEEEFKIKDDTVHFDVKISPYLAALGGNLEVPTLWGTTTIKIPPLTKTFQSFKLVNTGLIDKKTNKKGDEIVRIIIDIPKTLSEEEKRLYEKLKEIDLEKNAASNTQNKPYNFNSAR